MKIQWNKYFENIFVISGCSNFSRRKWIDSEFKRVGIHNYKYWYNFSDNKKLLLFDNLKIKHNYVLYGHYSLIKTCYELGYNNVLILEDDICFLNDLNQIENILEQFKNIQQNINCYLFDYYDPNNGNWYYADCYYLDQKGMKYLIYNIENFHLNIDCYWFKIFQYPNNINEFGSIYNLGNGFEENIYISNNILPIQIDISKIPLVIQKWNSDYPYSYLDENLYNKYINDIQ